MGSMALPNLNVQSDGSRVDRHDPSTTGVAGAYSGGLSYKDMLSSFMNDGGEKQSDNKRENNKSASGISVNQQATGNNDSMSFLNELSFKSLPIMNYSFGGQTASKPDESESNSGEKGYYTTVEIERDENGSIKLVEKNHYGPGWIASGGEIDTSNQVEDVVVSKDKTIPASATDLIKYTNNLDADRPVIAKMTQGGVEVTSATASSDKPVFITMSNGRMYANKQGSFSVGNSMPITTTVTVYDGDGESYSVPVYLTKTGNDEWVASINSDVTKSQAVIYKYDETPVTFNMKPLKFTFDENGNINKVNNGGAFISYKTESGAYRVTLDMSGVTQHAGETSINGTSNGYTGGYLKELNVNERGEMIGKYSNGILQLEGKVELPENKKQDKEENVEEKQAVVQSGIFGDLNNDWVVDEKDSEVLRGYKEGKVSNIYNADIKDDSISNEGKIDVIDKFLDFANQPTLMEEVNDEINDYNNYIDSNEFYVPVTTGVFLADKEMNIHAGSNSWARVDKGVAVILRTNSNSTYGGFSSFLCPNQLTPESSINIESHIEGKALLYETSAEDFREPNINYNEVSGEYSLHGYTPRTIAEFFGNVTVHKEYGKELVISGGTRVVNYAEKALLICGDENCHITSYGNDVRILGGKGKNIFSLSACERVNIEGGHNDDFYSMDNVRDVKISCGNGNDKVHIGSGENITIETSGGHNNISIEAYDKNAYIKNVKIIGTGGKNSYFFHGSGNSISGVKIEGFNKDDDILRFDYYYDNLRIVKENGTLNFINGDNVILSLPDVTGGQAKVTYNDKTRTLDEILGKTDNNLDTNEIPSVQIPIVPTIQSQERTHMATTPDGWVEYAKNATVTLDQWNMVHVNEEGNIDRIALTSLDRKAIIDRASTPIGITNQSGEILGNVQGSAEVVRKTNDNPSMKEQFNIVATGYNIKASVYADKSIVEAQNTIGGNQINAYGDYSIVIGGKGEDHINIYGKHVYAHGNEGKDTFHIGSANVSRKDASGRSVTTNYKAEAATIKGFDANEDDIVFGNSLGRLEIKGVKEGGEKAAEIRDASGKLIATVFTDDIDSVKSIVDNHNIQIEIQEALNGFEEKKKLIRDKITEAITDVFVPKEDVYAGIEKLTNSIIVTEKSKDADISKSVLIEFLKPIMDKISNSATSADVFKNPNSFYTWISNNVTNLQPVSVGNYTIRYDSSLVQSRNAAVTATVMQGNKKIAELAFTNVNSEEARKGIEEFGKAKANLNTEAWINFVKEFYKDAFGISLDNLAEIVKAKGRTDIAANVATAVVESFYNEDNKIVSSILNGVNKEMQLLFNDSDKMNSLKQLLTNNLGSRAKTVIGLLDCLIEFAPSLKNATTMTQSALKADSNAPLDVLEKYKCFSNSVDKLLK